MHGSDMKHNLLIIIFISLLLLPLADRIFHFLPSLPSTENREFALQPTLKDLVDPVLFTKKFDAYWSDNFGGRNYLIRANSWLWVKTLHQSPVQYVVFGKDNFLFYKSEVKNDGPSLNDYQGLAPLSQIEIDQITNSIKTVNEYLASRGVKLIIVVAPNKHTIYPELLPSSYKRVSNTARFDQLLNALPPDLDILDLRPTLTAGKSVYPTYYTTDSHWNNFGAYLASREIINSLHDKMLKPRELAEYKLVATPSLGMGDLASMLSARNMLPDYQLDLNPLYPVSVEDNGFNYKNGKYSGHIWTQPNAALPRLLLFGDSFRESLTPFLTPYFSTSYVMGFSAGHQLDFDLIDLSKPDIVIWEVAERYLTHLIQNSL